MRVPNLIFSKTVKHLATLFLVLFISPSHAKAKYEFEAGASLNLGAGSNEFAPFYIHSNRFGKITQSNNVQLDLWAQDPLGLDKRFDFSWGIEALAGYASKTDYLRFDLETKDWFQDAQGPAPIWLQQLYAEVKWRCLFLSVGMKDRPSVFVDQRLSSGDLLWSGNSRAIPEVRIGFVDFQNIPLTKKWLQFDICLSYGKFMDTAWINNHFDYYTGKRNPGGFWTYKRAALRSNPDFPFMLQGGFQMAGIFGGKTFRYGDGHLESVTDNYTGFKDFIEMVFPFWSSSTEGYKVGDTKGTWDVAARYRFRGGESLRAYVQSPWEDSSGLEKANGFDGLWGLEFKLGRRWWISGAVAEYLDMTNMSGPIIYDPAYWDHPLPDKVGGRDAYYNNYYYRSYVNYGLNMGSPMAEGILFFTGENESAPNNGWMHYFRVRGFHIAVEGSLSKDWDYIVKFNHRKAWGDTNSAALIHPVEADSFIAQASYRFPKVPGLTLAAAIGVDHGTMPMNAVGAMVTLTYERPFIFK